MDFKKASLAELREYAKEKGIRNVSTLKKNELAQLLENVEKMTAKNSESALKSQGEKTNADIENKPADKPVEAAKQEETIKPEGNIKYYDGQEFNADLDSGSEANGILEVMADGYGFIRSANYLPGDRDIYISPMQIRKFALKKGDIISGPIRTKTQGEKFSALLYIRYVNGLKPSDAAKRVPFEDLTPIFPNERIHLDQPGSPVAIRIVDLLSPIGKGQRGMIVSPPKAGKTTLLKAIAKSISVNNKDMRVNRGT